MAKAPDFTTERLMLRPFTAGDIDAMAAMDGDPEVMRFLEPLEEPAVHRTKLEGWLDDGTDPAGMALWTVRPRVEHDLYLGWVVLFPMPGWEPDVEIGLRFTRSAWGRGYATEAARAVMAHGFGTLGLERIFAVLDPRNLRSRRVCEKLGMHDAGMRRAYDTDCALYVKEGT
jgi:RimJ/RimL family protein N-acetyltransferase